MQAKVDNGRLHTFIAGTRSIVSTGVEKAICLRLLGALNHYTIHHVQKFRLFVELFDMCIPICVRHAAVSL